MVPIGELNGDPVFQAVAAEDWEMIQATECAVAEAWGEALRNSKPNALHFGLPSEEDD